MTRLRYINPATSGKNIEILRRYREMVEMGESEQNCAEYLFSAYGLKISGGRSSSNHRQKVKIAKGVVEELCAVVAQYDQTPQECPANIRLVKASPLESTATEQDVLNNHINS